MTLWLLIAFAFTGSVFGQGKYPAAAPGDRTADLTPKFVEMETYVQDKILGDPTPNEALASRLVSGLKDDFGDLAVNFEYQQMLVNQAVLVSMSADPAHSEDVNKILNQGLLDYWARHQVKSVAAAYDAANAMHFFELGQGIARTGTAGNAEVNAAVNAIYTKYASAHPLSGDAALGVYLSGAATPQGYINFWNGTLTRLGYAPVTAGTGVAATGSQFDRCIRRCKNWLGCGPGPITNIVCGAACLAPCIWDNIWNGN